MTNTFEGTIFVNATFSAEMTVTDYITQLFPVFDESQINAAVAQYTDIGLDTVNDQAIAIMGECKLLSLIASTHGLLIRLHLAIFICPTYLLLQSFNGPSFKVSQSSSWPAKY